MCTPKFIRQAIRIIIKRLYTTLSDDAAQLLYRNEKLHIILYYVQVNTALNVFQVENNNIFENSGLPLKE